ncbi:MAG: hypothetical protein U9R66_02180 [Thermodesulfobacteriota bacterium]|nr:hypothetical protein [Thermodesulfobacteriota bacterium]
MKWFFLPATVAVLLSGCSMCQEKPVEQPLQKINGYASSCYDRGVKYLREERFELAREQFSYAAAAAVNKETYDDAVDGMRRTEQLLRERR